LKLPRKRIIVIGSGEQFDKGLIDSLCRLSVRILFISSKPMLILEHEDGYKTCEVTSLEVPSMGYLRGILATIEEMSDAIIIPRSAPIVVHLWVLLRRFIQGFKLRSRVLRDSPRPSYVLWYSPSPAFIFKLPHYLFFTQSLPGKFILIYKAVMSILFNILISLAYDKILVKDPPTYTLLKRFTRNVLFLLPYMPRLTDRGHYSPGNIARGSILAVISIRRGGIASRYEERYLKLLTVIARIAREFKFVIIGTSQDEAEAILEKGLDNVIFLGRIYGLEYYNMLACCRAIFAYIEIPGASNRVAEAIAYGKPVITSELASSYHIGLKDLQTAIVLRLNTNSIRNSIAILKDDSALLEITRKLELLHRLYLQYNINQLRNCLIEG